MKVIWIMAPILICFQSSDRKGKAILILVFILALLVFLKNAWVAEDAYINFRSIEQLYAGNGPVWNPHERVQVYSSPLWYWLLALFRLLAGNLYLLSIVLSLLLFLMTLRGLLKLFDNGQALFFVLVLMMASNAFFDFTSSGLENGLAYLLLVFYYSLFLNLNTNESLALEIKKKISALFVLFGLLLLTRHDLFLLSLPPLLYTVKRFWGLCSPGEWTRRFLIGVSPFLLFTLFAVVYYGFPFPNTAYAKLNTGIPKIELIQQGGKYLLSSLRHDPSTLTVVALALFFAFRRGSRPQWRAMAWGVPLNLLYVVYVGGDFMQGRFLSFSFLTCTILLGLRFESTTKKVKRVLLSIVAVYLVLFPHTPFNSGFYYGNTRIEDGIADERGFYFNDLSLASYLLRSANDPFPSCYLAELGRRCKQSPKRVTSARNIGIMGYLAGTEKIIVDTLGLADPFLARLPAEKDWRIGHFSRVLPDGYLESVERGENMILDTRLKEDFNRMSRVTQGKSLFSWHRLKAIIHINTRL